MLSSAIYFSHLLVLFQCVSNSYLTNRQNTKHLLPYSGPIHIYLQRYTKAEYHYMFATIYMSKGAKHATALFIHPLPFTIEQTAVKLII